MDDFEAELKMLLGDGMGVGLTYSGTLWELRLHNIEGGVLHVQEKSLLRAINGLKKLIKKAS